MTSVSDAREALESAVNVVVSAYTRGAVAAAYKPGTDNAAERASANVAYHDAMDKLIEASKAEGAREEMELAAAKTATAPATDEPKADTYNPAAFDPKTVEGE